jgi:putative SOS response-associated peptidase YedK
LDHSKQMCDRYSAQNPSLQKLGSILGIQLRGSIKPRFNIAPGQVAPIITQDDAGDPILRDFRWGLSPCWSKDARHGNRLINLCGENIATLAPLRFVRLQRCLVVADGFYEWMEVFKDSQPLRFILTDHTMPMIFAGICATWPNAKGSIQPLQTYAVITTKANDLVGQVNDRMPAILPRHQWRLWLDSGTSTQELQSMLVPFDSAAMDCYRVCPLVNDPDFEDPAATKKYRPLRPGDELMLDDKEADEEYRKPEWPSASSILLKNERKELAFSR